MGRPINRPPLWLDGEIKINDPDFEVIRTLIPSVLDEFSHEFIVIYKGSVQSKDDVSKLFMAMIAGEVGEGAVVKRETITMKFDVLRTSNKASNVRVVYKYTHTKPEDLGEPVEMYWNGEEVVNI